MAVKNKLKIRDISYDKVFIVDDRNFWAACEKKCNKATDLVLCIDFALKLLLEESGYIVAFLDQIIDGEILQNYNFEMHNFLNSWHQAANGQNLLCYKYYNIGDALLLNVYNDITNFCHFFFNILAIKQLKYQLLYVCVNEGLITEIFDKLQIHYTHLEISNIDSKTSYFFPVSKWMNEKVNRTSLKDRFKDFVALTFDQIFWAVDTVKKASKPKLYIQGYFPTFGIIEKLKSDNQIDLILGNYTNLKTIYKERRVRFTKSNTNIDLPKIIQEFQKANKVKWEVDGILLSDYLHQIIKPVIERHFVDVAFKAESITRYFKNNPIKAMVPITNLWATNRLIMQYCKHNNIPIFMIINGLLNVDFIHDAKDSDWVNCYSESIKREYFNNSDSALPLGDPRMDMYAGYGKKEINRDLPTIIIGAAGFDVTDLNCYLAYEFDFLFDILTAISATNHEGEKSNLILKVRANGYVSLYKSFITEYFPDLEIRLEQTAPFKEVIKQADLYITFYSQTVFEASSIGIPVIFYKKNDQKIHAPFDGCSELCTANNIEGLKELINSFYLNDNCYAEFLKKNILEKYIGHIDGNNINRNVQFIKSIIS